MLCFQFLIITSNTSKCFVKVWPKTVWVMTCLDSEVTAYINFVNNIFVLVEFFTSSVVLHLAGKDQVNDLHMGHCYIKICKVSCKAEVR